MIPLDHSAWKARAKALEIETGLFIDGAFAPAADGASFNALDPANGQTVAEVSCGNGSDIDRAVASAKAAWDDGRWRHMSPRARMAIFPRTQNTRKLATFRPLRKIAFAMWKSN